MMREEEQQAFEVSRTRPPQPTKKQRAKSVRRWGKLLRRMKKQKKDRMKIAKKTRYCADKTIPPIPREIISAEPAKVAEDLNKEDMKMENIEAVDIELPRDEKGKLGLIMDSKLNIKDSGINARTAGIYPGMRVVAFFGKVVRSKRDILNIERKLRRKNLQDSSNVKITVIYDPYALTLHRASMLHKLTAPIKLSETMQRLKNRLEMTRKNRMEMTRKRPRPRPPVPPSKREHVAVPPPPRPWGDQIAENLPDLMEETTRGDLNISHEFWSHKPSKPKRARPPSPRHRFEVPTYHHDPGPELHPVPDRCRDDHGVIFLHTIDYPSKLRKRTMPARADRLDTEKHHDPHDLKTTPKLFVDDVSSHRADPEPMTASFKPNISHSMPTVPVGRHDLDDYKPFSLHGTPRKLVDNLWYHNRAQRFEDVPSVPSRTYEYVFEQHYYIRTTLTNKYSPKTNPQQQRQQETPSLQIVKTTTLLHMFRRYRSCHTMSITMHITQQIDPRNTIVNPFDLNTRNMKSHHTTNLHLWIKKPPSYPQRSWRILVRSLITSNYLHKSSARS